jgi:hypothetical protein
LDHPVLFLSHCNCYVITYNIIYLDPLFLYYPVRINFKGTIPVDHYNYKTFGKVSILFKRTHHHIPGEDWLLFESCLSFAFLFKAATFGRFSSFLFHFLFRAANLCFLRKYKCKKRDCSKCWLLCILQGDHKVHSMPKVHT